MAVPREKILISAAGKDGDHARQYFGPRGHVAQFGRVGANGLSATAPSAGTNGSDISVQLRYSTDNSALLVEGTKAWQGPPGGQTRWLVQDNQVLLLNDGYEGARGGNGGYGSNGANGGNAGKVLIAINEDDLDFLLPVYWDIRGGKGGQSSSHEDPGDGGLGGDPGDGIEWTEHHQKGTIVHRKSTGRRGPVGPPTARPSTYLQSGMGGAQGSSQITVLRNDGTQATYPNRYELTVVSFDVVDENNDGINEPGEHLCVKNIRIQNTGGMPSPKNHAIRVLIHGTHWLDPIATEPVYLPKNIQVDEIVEVPGILRAFIMQERVPRAPGQIFSAIDEVQLIATMPRINRTIPEFKGSTKIDIRYPLQLSPPKYLDCIAPGDHITFSWTLNISRKSYGIKGELDRSSETIVKDPGHLFSFIEAEAANAHEIVDPLEVLDPSSEVDISQTFKTPNSTIHQIIRFVRNELHLALDIFNLSVGGSFNDPTTGRNVLQNYPGKSIIFGNKFSYFNMGTSSALELLDPYLACQLAVLGTNFHFAGATENLDSMRKWTAMATFPIYAYSPQSLSQESVRAESLKALTETLQTQDKSSRTPDIPGTLVIREGFSKSTRITASVIPYLANNEDLPDYQKFMILSSLPFQVRSRMFWNMAGALDVGGIMSTVVLRGKALDSFKPVVIVSTQEIKAISEQRTEFIIQTLSIIQGSLLSFAASETFGGWFSVSRNSRLKKQVDIRTNDFLSRRFAPDVVAYLTLEAGRDAQATLKLIKSIPGAESMKSVSIVRLATAVQPSNARFEDLTDINASSVKWSRVVVDAKVIEYTGFLFRIQNQEVCSREILGVTKIELESQPVDNMVTMIEQDSQPEPVVIAYEMSA
ncbi:hypothetical protein G7Y89_g2200 [Cudoniella acicularis]|uniref:DUF7932 domain-containing protein n=1 Tax=Cudoniella acicularis TaxID=354080 RepID=A0A8H4RVL0_9HELO|nr:hypothetical protein G7Y89_g2200 [Cudoniella acicularis]